MKILPVSRIRRTKDCAFQKIVRKMVIVYPKERALHRLNEIGTDIWEFIGNGRRFSEIVDFITEEYEVEHATAEKDLKEFITELNEKKLVLIEE